jgi:hypothetical protein
MLPAAFDTWRGAKELGNGQALTPVQVATFAPFLAKTWSLPQDVVTSDLGKVRLYLGGPAAHTPWNAVTLAQDIYVQTDSELNNIVSWDGRRWLAHELGHVMQYRERPTPKAPDDIRRVRAAINRYVGAMLIDPNGGVGAIPKGIGWWFRENLDPRNGNKSHIALGKAVHDSHRLEIEAEASAQLFLKATAGLNHPA